ncbi:high-potential iron-sulfur protein [Rubrivirga sp. S365]|uniref:high-potential iron-sulfur protein n=1 Tax=Rubrivirga sp. S365 TaxID=3076080 RepID=UPI0028C879CD|nr:high-potential iron-sulfur protein [Rubrivirga sp. S365]MDT7855761.1 high-potential iron-sulfur protein [Rubrivirga sp. S365]
MSDAVSRRRFLAATAGAFALSPVLAACGGGDEGGVVAANCEGYGALTAAELQQRAALNYVDVTPIPGEMCSNCAFYEAPAGGAACGGCQLFAGPVAPGGYCTGWAAATA